MTKRIISFALTVLTVFAACSPAFAADTSDEPFLKEQEEIVAPPAGESEEDPTPEVSEEPGASTEPEITVVPEVTAGPEEIIDTPVPEPEATPEPEASIEPEATEAPGQATSEEPAEAEPLRFGKCGDDLTWSLDAAGTLTISGTGPMWDWSDDETSPASESPWYWAAEEIIHVLIEEGVTSIGNYAFLDCLHLTDITIPDSVTVIGETAFAIANLTYVALQDPAGGKETEDAASSASTIHRPEELIIRGHAGSVAETYAKNFGFEFVSFEVNLAAKQGWVTKNGRKYYYKNGKPVKGLQTIGKAKYYFSAKTGEMLTGLVTVDNAGHKSYFSAKTGYRLTGLVTTDKKGTQRYFSVKTGYMMKNGWVNIGGNRRVYVNAAGVVTDRQGGVLVSTPSQVEKPTITKDSLTVQDPFNYMQNHMLFESISGNDRYKYYRKYTSGKEEAYGLWKDYVETLCATGNFELTDSHYEVLSSGIFFDFALTYTGTGRVGNTRVESTFSDTMCDVTVYGAPDLSSCEGYIEISPRLTFEDLGLRLSGESVSVDPPGQSLSADLFRLSDGSYQTGDKRFHVSVGQAQVYRDGKAYTASAELERSKANNWEALRIDYFYRNECIVFTAPYNSLMTGDTFNTRTIGLNDKPGRFEQYLDSIDDFLQWKFSNNIVGVCHDGDYLFCYHDKGNGFEDVSVRIMYWDAKREEAVIYICATFDTAPYEFEALAAVKMETASSSSGGSSSGQGDTKEDCDYCDGSGKCRNCNGTGRVRRLLAGTTQWVDQICTSCSPSGSGKCSFCRGTGKM